MVLVAKGYRVVPHSLAVDNSRCGGHGFRHLHLKEHRGAFTLMRSTSAEKDGGKVVFAKGKTLFVGNVDDQGGRLCRKTIEDRLRQAFSSCGDILHVQASAAMDTGVIGASGTAAAGVAGAARKRVNGAARFAHVCFSTTKGVQKALSLREIFSGALKSTATTAVAAGKVDTQTAERDGGGHEINDWEEESRDENGDETCGYAALIQRHRRKFPPRQVLQEEVDSSMHRFESKEAAEMEKRKAMLENPEDGEGFVTVTYKRKRGRNSGGGNDGYSRDGAGFVADGAANKKRKGAAQLSDFYRFQMRETARLFWDLKRLFGVYCSTEACSGSPPPRFGFGFRGCTGFV
ncbi:unnamed protein product [Pylaiella littoralis]